MVRGAIKTWWQRWRRQTSAPDVLPEPAERPQTLGSEDEVFLAQLVADLGDGKRRDEIAGPSTLAKLGALWQSGHERLAMEWMEKLLSVPGIPAVQTGAVRALLVERYEERGELESAVVHLEVLASDEAYALRAHYLLAEHARRRGDHESASRHYEAVLGRDVDYPNVQARLERLRQRTGRAAPTAGETLVSGQSTGVGSGARYVLVRELGRGATGVVYRARDAELNRDVAIKILHPHLAGPERMDALARFFHEARVMAALRHPNIVAVLDLDQASRRIVMELATGGTLRDVLRDRGPRELRLAMECHEQVLSALAAAHSHGIIHCDIKPGNLMFRRDPDQPGVEVMLGDFGIAHLPAARGAQRIAASQAVGTLAYMAPEQRRGEVLPASDVYASAVVLFEMLTGTPPGVPEAVIAGARHRGDFVIPRHVLPNSPALADDVQTYLDRLSDPDPGQRPSTAQALADSQRLRERITATCAIKAPRAETNRVPR